MEDKQGNDTQLNRKKYLNILRQDLSEVQTSSNIRDVKTAIV